MMLDFRLRPPPTRPGLIRRIDVLEHLNAARDTNVIAVVAPPGYGKTTILSQLAEEIDRPAAWLTLDESDSDPIVLLSSLTGALASAGLVNADSLSDHTLHSDTVLTKGIARLGDSLVSGRRGVLFLDQVDHLQSQESRDVVGAVMTRLAGAIQVVIATRTGVDLPLALLRAQGSSLELTQADLAMGSDEAAAVFRVAGVDPALGLEAVMRRTEGWPAGIYLTAMAIKAGAPAVAELDVRGDDFYLADYLRQELLASVSDETMSFLTRSSILSRMSGPLCDFVLDIGGSANTLIDLEQSNLLIIPMDRTRTWYRYHTLLRDVLLAELERLVPGEVAALHSRAAAWFEAKGLMDVAMDHLQAAGETNQVAKLVAKHGRAVYASGRSTTLTNWLNWLETSKVLVDFPELAALGAFARSLDGDAGGAERLAVLAFNHPDGRPVDDDDLGPYARLLRSLQSSRGAGQAVADARAALHGFAAAPDFVHVAMGMEALARSITEGIEAADSTWADALWRSESLGAHPFTSFARAQRALVAIGRDDWERAAEFVEDSVEEIEAGGLDQYSTSALGLTLSARISARRGDVPGAEALLGRAASIRPRLTVATPILTVQTLLEMAKAFLEIADVAGARRVMRDATDILAMRPRLGQLVEQLDDMKERLSSLPAGAVGPSSLTGAELRLLPLLVTHLTYPEIGDRLFISRHTVKTQALSIYRKLGVSSRAEAVSKAREIGLLSL